MDHIGGAKGPYSVLSFHKKLSVVSNTSSSSGKSVFLCQDRYVLPYGGALLPVAGEERISPIIGEVRCKAIELFNDCRAEAAPVDRFGSRSQ